ncbi:MAG TPA: asparaginase [Vicinamibacterales bacterium]|nr:asparaginase [Vicinamibacterales bacterium]
MPNRPRLPGRTHRPLMRLASAVALLAGLVDPAAPVQAQQPAATSPTPPDAPRVFLFATGGTISNRQEGGRLTVDELITSIPNLDRYARVEGEQFSNIASGALTLEQWLDLSRRINKRFRDDAGLAGVVVTVGTDTLEELAYFLHLTVRDERPVTVVGAMRNPSTLGYEGPANLEDAFRVAAAAESRGMGTLVVLNDEINSARDVTKTDALRLDTFTSRTYGILGVADRDRVVYVRRPVMRHSARSEFDVDAITALPRVDVILTYQSAPGDLIQSAVDAGARGIVIAGAGAGATSGSQGQALREAADQQVFVVTTTRTGSGRVMGGGRGGNAYRIQGGDLQPLKARILLMLALATTSDAAEVRRIIGEY